MSDKVVTIKIEAVFGCSGMTESEAAEWALGVFLKELKEGRGTEKVEIIIDNMAGGDE